MISEGLRIEPQNIHFLMRSGGLTSICEKRENSDANQFRLKFVFKNRRGDKPFPSALRRPGV
ncbi:DUF6522 family protein [Methylocystis sp. IM3]|uniref:DUF6522 family protein n=1 Tax=unclassified Methylocystis TaxID=2625913 RepID=UPI0040535087